MADLKELMEQYAVAAQSIRLQLKKEIEGIEENEHIQRIGGGCFVVQFSELRNWNVMSAEFYDFSLQKERLKQVLASADTLENQLRRLADVSQKGKMRISGGYGSSYTMLFHPEVCQSLKQILDGISVSEKGPRMGSIGDDEYF